MSSNQENVINFIVQPGGSLTGELRVPGDKSISHRSIMLGSVAEGVTRVSGFLRGEDSLATLKIFQELGVKIDETHNGDLLIHGVGLQGLQAPNSDLDVGNSGTAIRLLAGLLAGQKFDSVLVGDESIAKRPMRRVTDPLTQMGACIETTASGTTPIQITATPGLHGIEYELPVASAQIKSCLLLAGLYAQGKTEVHEPAPTRDHTERMLRSMGYEVNTRGNSISLIGGGRLTSCQIDVPADISSAAFFMVGASIAENSNLLLRHVGINPTRIGVINILRKMGADIEIERQYEVGTEPVADIRVKSAALKGIEIPKDQVPLAIDEFPVLFIAAACAEGETVLSGAKELRVKESDRIQAMADGLNILGVQTQTKEDGIVIQGGSLGGGQVDSLGDHRIAMAFAIAGLKSKSVIEIRDCANVNTSFPNFIPLASRAGLIIEPH